MINNLGMIPWNFAVKIRNDGNLFVEKSCKLILLTETSFQKYFMRK